MAYQTMTTITDKRIRREIIVSMCEWCGTTYFNCRYNKNFTIVDVVLNQWGGVSFRSTSSDGKIEDFTNERDIKYNESMRSYLNVQKPQKMSYTEIKDQLLKSDLLE